MHRDGRARDARPPRRRLRRRPQGVGALARRRGRHRPRLAGRSAASAAHTWPTSDKIPTSRVAPHDQGRPPRGRPGRAPVRARARRTSRAPTRARRRRWTAASVETAEQIVAALGTMKGAAMKLGQVMSFLDVGLVPEEFREEFQAQARRAARRRAEGVLQAHAKVIEDEYDEPLDEVFESSTRCRSPPPRSGRSTRRACTTGATSRSRSSTRRRRRGPGRHAEPRDDPAAHEARRARARPQGARRRDPLAHRRGARLRARGRRTSARSRGSSAATRSSSCPTSSRGCRASASSCQRVRRRAAASRSSSSCRRPSATASARSSSASTSAACTATTSSPATRTRATRCCSTTGAWRSSTSACSSGSRADGRRVRARRPSAPGSRARARSCIALLHRGAASCRDPSASTPDELLMAQFRDSDLVVHDRRGASSSRPRSPPR